MEVGISVIEYSLELRKEDYCLVLIYETDNILYMSGFCKIKN